MKHSAGKTTKGTAEDQALFDRCAEILLTVCRDAGRPARAYDHAPTDRRWYDIKLIAKDHHHLRPCFHGGDAQVKPIADKVPKKAEPSSRLFCVANETPRQKLLELGFLKENGELQCPKQLPTQSEVTFIYYLNNKNLQQLHDTLVEKGNHPSATFLKMGKKAYPDKWTLYTHLFNLCRR